jgi:hypothetical protein
MAVTIQEIEEMARIRRILNGEYAEEMESVAHSVVTEHQTSYGDATYLNESPREIGTVGDPTDDMKEILRRFNQGASQSVQRIAESDDTDREFHTALVTEKTPNGVKVGSWEIKVYEDQGNKTYDICNVKTAEPIARDLTLYESALAITKMLNKNMGINHRQVMEVLTLEDDYARARQDAALFKRKARRMNESQNQFEACVADDRYREARALAIKHRDKIVFISRTV